MASLRKRLKSDNWVCCYATADGRRTQRSTGTTDKDEAMAICRRWENEEYALRENGEPTEGLAVANKRALVAGLVSIVVVILGLVGYWQYDRWKNGPELFVDVPENEQPATFFESNFAKRHRWVRLSPDALERLNTLGGKIRLNLFDDLKVNTEVVVRRFIDGGAETSVGWLDDDPDTMMLMCRQTAQPGKLMGVVVDTLGTQYLISHEIDGKHVIVEVDQTKIPGCGGVVEMGPAKQTVKTAAARPASSTRDPAEAQALQRRMRGTVAQAFIGTGGAGGHEHGTGVACTRSPSWARRPSSRCVKVPIPRSVNKTREQTPLWAAKAPRITADTVRLLMPSYYGMVKCLDDNIGRLIETLRKNGQLENTVIVFTSDHGDLCGEHGRLNKGVPYEGSARIPFLIYCPGKIKSGTVVGEALSCVDFLPTVMSLMDVKHGLNVNGRNAANLFRAKGGRWRDLTFLRSTSNPQSTWLCAVSDRYKLVYASKGKPWLFDLQKDADELINRFTDPAYQAIVRDMTRGLSEYCKVQMDPFGEVPHIKTAMAAAKE